MTDIQKGDRVRVVAEGVVEGVTDHLVRYRVASGQLWCSALDDCVVEVIERAKREWKVGDTVVVADSNADLPPGAIVRDEYGFETVKLGGDRWFSVSRNHDMVPSGMIAARTIQYLPESS